VQERIRQDRSNIVAQETEASVVVSEVSQQASQFLVETAFAELPVDEAQRVERNKQVWAAYPDPNPKRILDWTQC
jgi:hypothetical protein